VASFNVVGLDEAEMALLAHQDRAAMKVHAVLEAGAKILVAAQRSSARTRLRTRTGQLARNIGKSKVGNTQYGRNIQVYPQGKRESGARNAHVGFILEYGALGTKNIDPREWMEKANAEVEDEVNAAMLGVWEELDDG